MPEDFLAAGKHLKNLTDPRNGKAKRHSFGEILFIALAAMVCGMEGFHDSGHFDKLNIQK